MTRARAAWLTVIVLVSACVLEEPTAPTEPAATPGKHLPGIQRAPGDIFGTFVLPGPPNNNVPTTTQNTGIVLPPTVPVRVTVTGQLRFDVNPGFEPCAHNPPVTLPGANPVGPAGFDQGNRPYAVVMGLGDATNPPSSAFAIRPLSSSAATVTAFAQGPGVIWAGRPTVIPNACEGPGTGFQPAYFVSGSQTIVAEELPPAVLNPDKTSIHVGDQVTFTLEVPWTSNYFIIGSWSWIPDPPGPSATRFISGCGFQEGTCTLEIHERGHAQLDGIVAEGAVFLTAVSPAIEVNAAPLRVELVADRGTLKPRIIMTSFPRTPSDAPKKLRCRFPELTADETRLRAIVTRGGEPVAGATVSLSTQFVAKSGGHDHQAADREGFGRFRPPGGAPSSGQATIDGTTDASGTFTVLFAAGTVAGQERLKAQASEGGSTADDELTIEVDYGDMQTLGASADYQLIGTTSTEGSRHLSNHWGFAAMTGHLTAIATAMRSAANDGNAQGSLVLRYNDMTLQRGGVFDLGRNATDFVPPHETHNRGLDADIDDHYGPTGTDDIGKALDFHDLERSVRNRMKGALIVQEGNHYHVRFLECPAN